MKKEELMKLEGMTELLAEAVVKMAAEEVKEMVPRSRLNEVIAERDNAKKEHNEVLSKLGIIQKESGDAQALKTKIAELENTSKEVQKAHAAEIKQLRINNAVNTALMGAKALNQKAVKALLNLDNAELLEDGSVKGLAEQIAALQKADDSKFMFGSSDVKIKGAKSGESGNEEGDKKVDVSKMTYSQQMAYLKEHPDYKINY